MEENLRSDNLPPPAVVVGGGNELNCSSSDASSLAAENCRDSFRGSDNVTPDDCTAWTDEKHRSYINHLEESFVTQLHQSMGMLAPRAEQNIRDKSIPMMQPINITVSQYGCWQKNNDERSKPLFPNQADSHNPLKSPWMYNIKHTRKHCPPPSSDMPEKHGKEGTGQNFVDEDNQNKSNIKPRAKRSKTALADTSNHDQIVP